MKHGQNKQDRTRCDECTEKHEAEEKRIRLDNYKKSNELIASAVMRLFQEQAYGTIFLFGVWQRKINRHEYVLAEHQ